MLQRTLRQPVQNEGAEKASVELTHNIFKKGTEESIGSVTTQAQEVEAGKSQVIEATTKAKSPSLWSPENPALSHCTNRSEGWQEK